MDLHFDVDTIRNMPVSTLLELARESKDIMAEEEKKNKR